MGCDIHLYREKKVGGQWVTADRWVTEDGITDVPHDERFTDRDYDLFGLLSDGVRSSHKQSLKERGVPFNACKEVADCFSEWGSDGHSASYVTLAELKDLWSFLQSEKVTITGLKTKDALSKLQASIDSDEETDWDLLYPYWQGSSDMVNDVEFSVEVPASYKLSGVQRIIALFEGIEGEDHRIVFWFDN